MRVGLYEYLTAELSDSPGVPHSLQEEGRAMRAAVLADFEQVAGVTAFAFQFHRPAAERREEFQAQVNHTDYALVIAPEFDDILHTRCSWVETAGGQLLGPSSAAVRLTADKLTLGRLLGAEGIPIPPTVLFEASRPPPTAWPEMVAKPRWGAGSQATYRITASQPLAHHSEWFGAAILQPYIPGQPASVAFLVGPRQVLPLRPAAQTISTDGRCRYLGGRVPLSERLSERAARLASRAIAVVPGLRGYVGVDLILGDDPGGADDVVLEINPRLTTSYIGLRVLAENNLAEAMLRVVMGCRDVAVRWRPGSVRFGADGSVEHLAE